MSELPFSHTISHSQIKEQVSISLFFTSSSCRKRKPNSFDSDLPLNAKDTSAFVLLRENDSHENQSSGSVSNQVG